MDLTSVNLLISATAVTASVAAPVATFAVGRLQVRASVLSLNRQKWIDAFRDLISSFCSQVTVAALTREKLDARGLKAVVDDHALLVRYEGLALTAIKIELMTNAEEKDHDALVAIVNAILSQLRSPPIDQDLTDATDAEIRCLVHVTQVILKREWARVKRGR